PFVAYALPAQTTTASVETGHWLVEGWNLQEADKTNPLLTPGLHWLQPEKVRSSPVQTGTATDPATLPVQRFGRLELPEVQGDTLIRLEKDQNVEIRIRARQLDSLLDPVLLIREQEKVLREVDDIAKEELDVATTWKAPSTGDFTFSVIDRYGHAGARYFYLLEVESALPRIECSVDAENFTGKAGAPLEIPITINRLNGFTEAVTFNVTGLTENQTVEHVVSETKGDSAKKVTLKIQHNGKEPFQGPVQIIAHWGEETGNEQLVTRSLKLPDYKIDQFWVTLPVEK
ncbi:MAG: hypothetical protein KDA78_20170, partial [Planctomycetaceae bacterium]|nr:hypothetical protein [Planctomycetaceae bacterium]